MGDPVPWWRTIDRDLIVPFRVLQFGLQTWQSALEGIGSPSLIIAVDIFRTRGWLQYIAPQLDAVMHEFIASSLGVVRTKYETATCMHELAFRSLNRWVRRFEELVMFAKHGSDGIPQLSFPAGCLDRDPFNPPPEYWETIWDYDMKVQSDPLKFERVEPFSLDDCRYYTTEGMGRGSEEPFCPDSMQFDEMIIGMKQEICRAYAHRSIARKRTAGERGSSAGKQFEEIDRSLSQKNFNGDVLKGPFTLEQLATIFGRTSRTIRRWINSEQLSTTKVGSSYLIPERLLPADRTR